MNMQLPRWTIAIRPKRASGLESSRQAFDGFAIPIGPVIWEEYNSKFIICGSIRVFNNKQYFKVVSDGRLNPQRDGVTAIWSIRRLNPAAGGDEGRVQLSRLWLAESSFRPAFSEERDGRQLRAKASVWLKISGSHLCIKTQKSPYRCREVVCRNVPAPHSAYASFSDSSKSPSAAVFQCSALWPCRSSPAWRADLLLRRLCF